MRPYSSNKFNPFVSSQPGLILRKPTVIETAERWAFKNITDSLYWIKHPAEYYIVRINIRLLQRDGYFRYLDGCYLEYLKNILDHEFNIESEYDYDAMHTIDIKLNGRVYGRVEHPSIKRNYSSMEQLRNEALYQAKKDIRMYIFIYRLKMHRVV